MGSRFSKFSLLVAAVIVVSGCAQQQPIPQSRNIEDVYSDIHREGARDAVALLREGLRSNYQMGYSSPTYPIVNPAVVIRVWRPAYIDPQTNHRIDGAWEYIMLKDSEWAQ